MGVGAPARQSPVISTAGRIMSGDERLESRNFIDRLHPRTRLLATLSALIFVTAIHNLTVLGLALVAALTLVFFSGLSWPELRHRLVHVEGFLIALLLLLPFTIPGAPLFTLGPLTATTEGFARSLMIVVKVNTCAITIFALIGLLDPVVIGQTAKGMGVPARFVTLFLFTVRYVSVFREETARLREAMRARAFLPGSNSHTWRTFGNLAGMMMVRSLERAQRVDEAMRCRGFAGSMPAVPLPATKRRDAAFAAVFAGTIVGLLVMEFRI